MPEFAWKYYSQPQNTSVTINYFILEGGVPRFEPSSISRVRSKSEAKSIFSGLNLIRSDQDEMRHLDEHELLHHLPSLNFPKLARTPAIYNLPAARKRLTNSELYFDVICIQRHRYGTLINGQVV